MSSGVPQPLILLTLLFGLTAEASAQPKTTVRLGAVGDVMFSRIWRRPPYVSVDLDRPFRHVRHLLRGHDITLCNLENPIVKRRVLLPQRLGSLPPTARLLQEAGFTVVGTANNHSHDQGEHSVVDTLRYLGRRGLGTAGMGLTWEAAWKAHRITVRGVRVAVFGASVYRNVYLPDPRGHVAWKAMKRMVRFLPKHIRAHKGNADFVILSLHFGVEYVQSVFWSERRFFRQLQAAGVNVIIGHHPHVLRAMERRPGFVGFYSLGNFLFRSDDRRSLYGAAVQIELIKQGAQRRIGKVLITPVVRGAQFRPQPATGREAAGLRRLLRRLSKRVNRSVRLVRRGEGLELL